MARTTRLTPYEEQNFGPFEYEEQNFGPFDKLGAFDEDESISPPIPYPSTRQIATNGGLLAEESIPLFLSSDVEQYGQPSFGKIRQRATISSIILKTSSVAAVAAVIAFAVLSMGDPLPLFANTKASLIGASLIGASAGPLNQVQRAPAIQPAVAAALAAPPVASSAPTREEIAAAFAAARQNQAEILPPTAAVPPPARQLPARRLDADVLETLLSRARALIEIGDIASARLLLERAADAQEASAALLLAQTYDPTVLGTQDMRSVTPDPAAARDWYQKAAQLGSRDAQARLAQMQN
jgi:hypothetical protein